MQPTLNLHGKWRYELDYHDRGLEEEWFHKKLKDDNFIIPGTTASNKVGNPVVIQRELTKESVKCLREEYKYLGAAWYQNDFIIGNEFEHRRIQIVIERVMFESTVWIDGRFIGKRDSLSTQHAFDITEYIEIGKTHILTVRMDNRDIYNIGPNPSAYTDETQTIWNGMVGRVEIIGQDEIVIENVVIGLNARESTMSLSFDTDVISQSTKPQLLDSGSVFDKTKDKLLLAGDEFENTKAHIDVSLADGTSMVAVFSTHYDLQIRKERVKLDIRLDETVEYWDEFSPKLYDLKINISYLKSGRLVNGNWSKKTGLKEITSKDSVISINGIQRFLRGNIDCCVFPLTAYPPMDFATWRDICNTTKEYGLNHIRFHSWCPPEAAFQAADEVGLYLQVEGPVWMDHWTGYTVGCYEEHHKYLPEEALRIILTYSHHPSFCIFSNGNELNGDFDLLERIIHECKNKNPHILYTLTTNWDRKLNPKEDIFIAQSVDGVGVRGQYFLDQMTEGTKLSYNDAVKNRSAPVISHEVGQYVVYPNVEEIAKYNGVLKAVNLESIKRNLDHKNLTSYVPDYVMASGKLSALLYKAELEAALRTEDLGGIQLLSLHDFPGQSTATVGLLDCFYHSKGIITPKEFRTFCNSTVLLVNMPKFRYLSDENFEFELEIAHYSNEELKDVEVEVTLRYDINNTNQTFWTTNIALDKITIGLNKGLFHFKDKIFAQLKGRNAFTLTACIKSMEVSSSWDIWVYEDVNDVAFPNSYEALDDDAVARLEAGENIIIFAKQDRINQVGIGKFFPVFWSPVHFLSQDPCGMIIKKEHPFFTNYYPVKQYADIEWKNLLENSFSINIDKLVGFEPITMPVPNFYNNHKFSNLFEAKVLHGKVIICSLDLDGKREEYPEIRSFKKALRDYYLSEDFCPTQTIDIINLQNLFKGNDHALDNKENIALNKPAFAGSVKAESYDASKGNDGNPLTKWIAADADVGHSWMVDLQGDYDIKGTKVVFNEEGIILYVIHTSIDGKEWNLVVNQTGQTKKDKERTDYFEAKARYVKITYNGLPEGLCAGHQEFEVYL